VTTQGQGPVSGGRIARLDRRAVVAVGGPQAADFLNALVTAEVARAGAGKAVYAGLLSPQGKVLFDFVLFIAGERILLDVAADRAAELAARLTHYRLRAKVTIAVEPALQVYAGWQGAALPPAALAAAPDPRLAALGWRAVVAGAPAANASAADYDAHRIDLGVPEGGIDFAFGDAFPHDADMDQLGGVDFSKGCFVGQEVVTRMERRGTARRRLITASSATPLPPAGTPITAAGTAIGTLSSSADGVGLALLRLDRAKAAIDRGEALTAGDATLALAIPPWARFVWPTGDEG
jgi:folate-binding protein YgfZ